MKRQFHVVPESKIEMNENLNANYEDVCRILSEDKENKTWLQLFSMHSWRPGRWMNCVGFCRIYCVDKQIS